MDPIFEKIKTLKAEKKAVILAHTYQRPEIQDVADFVGDSLELSFQAKETKAETIIFCGVRFMAETAKIISPEKKVIMPDLTAGCPMAEMVTAEQVKELKAQYPGYQVVCYVNSTAEVKAESDICCTSSNALRVVESIPFETGVIFVPDMNLGLYVKNKLQRDNFVLWPGYCFVHAFVTKEDLMELKDKSPNAKVMAHPECKTEILELADYVLSTSKIITKVGELEDKEFIIVTEEGIIHPLEKKYPEKKFHHLSKMLCVNMKINTMDILLNALQNDKYEINISEPVLQKAKLALDRMMNVVS
jgi:quinolinate synthase